MIKIGNLILNFLVIVILLSSCKNNQGENVAVSNSNNYIDNESPRVFIPEDDSDSEEEETRKIKDGSYTADIEYYNTTTGVNTLYVTKVHVVDGYLKDIKWPNGVWLHSSYFSPQKIRKDGTCIIRDINEGYENKVRILNLEYH